MAGFGNVLGNVAGGFEQARQMDAQRQFEAEQNRRAQIGGFLQKLAMDETVHPYTRNAAAQQYLGLVNTPPLKPWKPDIESLVPPAQPKQATPPAQPTFTSGAPGAAPQISMPQPPPGLTAAMQGAGAGTVSGPSGQTTSPGLQAPPTPPSVSPGAFLSPAEVTQMQASRVGAVTGAQAGAEMGSQVYTRGPGNQLNVVPLSKAGAPLPAIPNAVSPWQLQGRGMRATAYMDPVDGQPKIGSHNLLTGEVLDQDGNVVPNAVPFESSLVTKGTTSTESMGASGGITKRNVTGPVKAGQNAGAQSTQGNSAKPAGSPHLTSGGLTNWADDDSPVGLAARRWATQGQSPKGGAMAERQVLSYMKQHGLQPALPVPPALQDKIQESFVARNSAIGLIDDIQKNSNVLDSLITAGKIQTAMNPSTGAALVTRATDLTDREAKVAGDYQQLVEHVNLLRGPLGATGFRGPEAWAALQAQRGNLMSDPRITRQVLAGMRDRLAELNNADKMILSGQGMTAPPTPSAMTRIKASDGSLHDIPSDKMDLAKQRDPGLQVVQ